ncbi:MAG: dihydropteroate synthase [Dorea sp.]|nr:dihydropteroate synthase [Dorea sp.]
MKIGKKIFDTEHRVYIMGILNVTPDSFSDGGRYLSMDSALFHAQEMVDDGADVLDVGGESTRPGHVMISEEEEICRTAEVIENLKKNFDVPVSIDTYKSRVAKVALAAGADLVNDIWGLKYDKDMAKVIAESGAACCLMHNRKEAVYSELVADVCADLAESVRLAEISGIGKERIMLDPGIGFGKTHEMNLEMLRRLGELKSMGYPILLGASRKSVIGLTLDLVPEERLEGTLATTVVAVMNGCSFVRVHDVKENLRAVRMTEAILKS